MSGSIAAALWGGEDEAIAMLLGDRARRGTGWAYIQDQGNGVVGIVGSVRVPEGQQHPFAYDSPRTHKFLVGEIIVRPHLVVATDALRGKGVSGLYTGGHDLPLMLTQGEVLVVSESARKLLRQEGVR